MANLNKIKRSHLLMAQLLLFFPLLILFTFFAWTAWSRYDLPYNEMGRYFDEEQTVVYQEQALEVYVFISVILLLAVAFVGGLIAKTIGFKNKAPGETG